MTSQTLTTKTLAKEIFCRTYRYPAIPFRSLGRECFAWAMTEARRQIAETARIAAIPAEVKEARLTAINDALLILDYRSDYSRASRERGVLLAERNALSATV